VSLPSPLSSLPDHLFLSSVKSSLSPPSSILHKSDIESSPFYLENSPSRDFSSLVGNFPFFIYMHVEPERISPPVTSFLSSPQNVSLFAPAVSISLIPPYSRLSSHDFRTSFSPAPLSGARLSRERQSRVLTPPLLERRSYRHDSAQLSYPLPLSSALSTSSLSSSFVVCQRVKLPLFLFFSPPPPNSPYPFRHSALSLRDPISFF